MFIAILCLGTQRADAELLLQDYDPNRHDRFVNHPNFLGNPHDWSGVGRSDSWATMISPTYFVSATHSHPGANSIVRFYTSNDPSGAFSDHAVMGGMAISGSDLWLGRLETPVGADIATYPILSLPNLADYADLELYTYGLANAASQQANMRLGRNTLDAVFADFSDPVLGASQGDVFLFDFDNVGGVGADESLVQPGDSGAPTFIIVNGRPVLIGIHWFSYTENGSLGSGDTLVSSFADALNDAMIGERIMVVSIPEPSALAATGLLLVGLFTTQLRKRLPKIRS